MVIFEESWVLNLAIILATYGSIITTGYLLIQLIKRHYTVSRNNQSPGLFERFLRGFAIGQQSYQLLSSDETSAQDGVQKWTGEVSRTRRILLDCFSLLSCFAGIQATLITMGFFQEKIMTRPYSRSIASTTTEVVLPENDYFKDAQFLVLINRIFSLVLCGFWLALTWRRQPSHVPPFYLHSFSSLSNIISSWCVYEGLKYVSFPVQAVCKASKIIPTMIMGKILTRQRYTWIDYMVALSLILGASLFFTSAFNDSISPRNPTFVKTIAIGNSYSSQNRTELPPAPLHGIVYQYSPMISGLILMSGYLLFDAFTPNWQKKLFDKSYKISATQMMFAVNAFSVIFCVASLLQQWSFLSSFNFIFTHNAILVDCLFLSLGSAFGQVFIYYTVQRFGPVILAIMMTLRQIFSILLSSLHFGHPLTIQGFFGLLLVFSTVFFDIFRRYKKNSGLS